MRRLTLALLSGSYFCIALLIALVTEKLGGGAGLAGFVGTLGLCLAVQGLIARIMQNDDLTREVDKLRQAQLILAGEIEKIQSAMADVIDTFAVESRRRSEEIYTEVQMLEDVVQQIGERLEAQLSAQVVERAEAAVVNQSPQASALLNTVRAALDAGRVDLYLQAVVSLPQRQTRYYESFSRLRDETGRVLMPAEFLSVAEPGGLVAAIDNLLLFRCVQIVRRLAGQDRKVGIFCNISLASLGDEDFFGSFMEFMAANRDLAGSVIFELGQSAFNARGALEARNMAKLADLGFRFSIDKVVDLGLDFTDFARADVAFVKIGAPLLIDELTDEDGELGFKSLPGLPAPELAALARRHGVELVVEKVESERQVVDILDLDIALGQGHLFGEPRPIRDAVLAETEPPVAFIQAALRRRAG